VASSASWQLLRPQLQLLPVRAHLDKLETGLGRTWLFTVLLALMRMTGRLCNLQTAGGAVVSLSTDLEETLRAAHTENELCRVLVLGDASFCQVGVVVPMMR
jgi:hypothetical protein